VGKKGGGTSLTWEVFCKEDNDYKDVKVKYKGGDEALLEVLGKKESVMLFVSGLNSPLLEKANEMGNRLTLVPVNDSDFNDAEDTQGNDIYEFHDVPDSKYTKLQKFSIWQMGSQVETITVKALVVVRTEWLEKAGEKARKDFITTLLKLQKEIDSHQEATTY
jgi:hypothetical protein